MRNFKKLLVRGILILAFLFCFEQGVRFVYEPVGNNSIYTVKDLKTREGTLETLVLGTSLAHWGIDTNVLEQTIDSPSFNLATSAQPLDASYYLLKDQAKRNPLKRVFLGIHVTSLINENQGIQIKEGVFDRILSPVGKAEYLLRTAGWKEFEQYLFYAARVENVLTKDKAIENIKYKMSEKFKNGIPPEGQYLFYLGSGNENKRQVYDGKFAKKKLGEDATWKRSKVIEATEDSLEKIGKFCEQKGIELNLVVMPMTWEFTKLMGDLDDFHAYLQEFCDENRANLYDFHTYEGVYDGLFTNEDYQDKKHFNVEGAKKCARILGEWYLSAQ